MNQRHRNEYKRLHAVVARRRGRAAEHACIDCGKPAAHWSQRHDTDPVDVANYDPRCVSCHKRYDLGPGYSLSDETRAKMSAALRGQRRTSEERARISEGVRRWRANHD